MTEIEATFDAGCRSHQAGDFAGAERAYRRVLAEDPGHAEACYLLGEACWSLGKVDEAVASHRRGVELAPRQPETHYGLGVALKGQGKLDEARECFEKALALRPGFSEAHNDLGCVLKEQERIDEALACLRRAIELKPDFAEAHDNLGVLLRGLRNWSAAEACHRRAIQLKPGLAKAYSNLGVALTEQGRIEEALASHEQAMRLKPNDLEVRLKLGNTLAEQGRFLEALDCCEQVLRTSPDSTEAHFNRAFLWLLLGRYDVGWPEHEWRLKRALPVALAPGLPLWDGAPLEGRTILVWAEQGYGDTLQFARFLPRVKQQGGTVVLASQGPLVRLMKSCAGVDQVISLSDPFPRTDVHVSLMSLPYVFGITSSSIPATVPYLAADPRQTEEWRTALAEFPGFKVGIAWQGNPAHLRDHRRSIPLNRFEPLARVPGIRLFSLQRGFGREQLGSLPSSMTVIDVAGREEERGGDFLDAASIVANLDLVICCDTSLAHLAGALGVPVWVALPTLPDWRWLESRADSPWYPQMRLFRQPAAEDWSAVFRTMAQALGEVITQRPMS